MNGSVGIADDAVQLPEPLRRVDEEPEPGHAFVDERAQQKPGLWREESLAVLRVVQLVRGERARRAGHGLAHRGGELVVPAANADPGVLRDVESALHVHAARELGRRQGEDEGHGIDAKARRRFRVALVMRMRIACVHAEREVDAVAGEGERGGAAEAVAPIVLARFRARALGEAAESRRCAQPEIPHALLGVERRCATRDSSPGTFAG